MKKILVTGATGFIGSHCIKLLKKRNYEIHALSRNPEESDLNSNIFWYKIDLFNKRECELIFKMIKPDDFMHLAWKTDNDGYYSDEHEKWYHLSKFLIDLFYKFGGKRILIAGTCFEYDLRDRKIVDENTSLIESSSYGKNKIKLYTYLQSIGDSKNKSYIWGRIFFTYGPGQRQKSLVPYVVSNLIDEKLVETTDGNQIYDYLYVEDIASALVLLLESSYIGAVNISSGEPITLKNLVLKIAKIFKREDLIVFDAKKRPENSPDYIIGNNELLKKVTKWNQKFDINEGIKKYISNYKENKL